MRRAADPLGRLRAANPVRLATPPDWAHVQDHIRRATDAGEDRAGRAPTRPRRRLPRPRRALLSGAAGAAGVLALVAAGALLLSPGPGPAGSARALAFPIFSEPATDVSAMRFYLQTLVRRGADLRDARAIATPYGTGYVTTGAGGSELCVAVPPRPPGGRVEYVGSCEQVAKAGRAGLVVSLAGSDAVEFVAVLPSGASDPVAHEANGIANALAARAGIVGTVEHRATTITYRVGESDASIGVAPTGVRCTHARASCRSFLRVGPPRVCSVIGDTCSQGCSLFVDSSPRRAQPEATGGFCSPTTLRGCTEYVAGAGASPPTPFCKPQLFRKLDLERVKRLRRGRKR